MLYKNQCITDKIELHACFYGGIVGTYKIPSIQNVVY